MLYNINTHTKSLFQRYDYIWVFLIWCAQKAMRILKEKPVRRSRHMCVCIVYRRPTLSTKCSDLITTGHDSQNRIQHVSCVRVQLQQDTQTLITCNGNIFFSVLKTTDVRAVGFRECLNEVTSYLYNYQDCKQEHKGQLLSHLNTVISPRPNVSDHACQSSVWPLTTRRVAEKETTCSYERTLLPLNHFKQQNPCLPTDNSATRNLHRVPLVTDSQNNKQLASHFTLFPVYNDNAMRFVGFPFTPR